ncbi:hypothetical protein, partial [Facklamia sp. P12950]
AIRPANSLAAKLECLSVHEREIFDTWKADCALWHAQFQEPDAAYEALLEGNSPPSLYYLVRTKLFGPDLILNTADAESEWRNKCYL